MADTEGSIVDCVERRRRCRIRFTKYTKVVEQLIMVNDAKKDDGEADLHAVKAVANSFEEFVKINEELRMAQDAVEFHKGYEQWFSEKNKKDQTEEESNELWYVNKFIDISATVEVIQITCDSKDKELSVRSDGGSTKSNFSPEDLAESLRMAFQGMNFGVSADQLQTIVSSLAQKKRHINIPKFSGDGDFFETWDAMVEAELQKPGYSEAEKGFFVLSLLDGEAKQVVTGLKNPSHVEVLKFLELRYGDVKEKIEKAVLDIAEVDRISVSSKDLDGLYTKLLGAWNYILKKHENSESLKNESWILSALVRSKLPKEIIRDWEIDQAREERDQQSATIMGNRDLQKEDGFMESVFPEDFEKFLERLYGSLQLVKKTESSSRKGKPEGTDDKRSDKRENGSGNRRFGRPSGYALNIQKNRDECAFCKREHKTWNCTSPTISQEMRMEIAWQSELCFNCLKPNHRGYQCFEDNFCRKCPGRHHTLLHFDTSEDERESSSQSYPRQKLRGSNSNLSHRFDYNPSTRVLLKSAIVKVEGRKNVLMARVLFDSGSTTTFISTDFARKLGSFTGKTWACEFSLVGNKTITTTCREVVFDISSALPSWKGETFKVMAYTLDKPAADLEPVEINLKDYQHLSNLKIVEKFPHGLLKVDVLLSIIDSDRILMDTRCKGDNGEPCAQLSHVGWVPYGMCRSSLPGVEGEKSINQQAYNIKLSSMVEKFWEMDSIGILPDEESQPTYRPLEIEAMRQHETKTEKIDGHYQTGLIVHPDFKDSVIPHNKDMALKRLKGLELKCMKNSEWADICNTQVQELLDNGRAELVNSEQLEPDHQTWYLPAQIATKMDSTTTKYRLVWDGSAKNRQGTSLNSTLLPGPALQPDLLGILLRFRQHQVCLVADIEKMFLNIKMDEVSRDRQRFLWRFCDSSRSIETYRLTGVTFGLTPSPFSSIMTVLNHAQSEKDNFPVASREIGQNIFVDDVLTGGGSVQEAAKLALEMKELMARGGFTLRKFISNRPEALAELQEQDLASYHVKNFNEETFSTKTLGVQYRPKEDVLQFSFVDKLDIVETESRRTMMRQFPKIYDVIGVMAPFTIRARQLLQLSWINGDEWDDPLTEDILESWLEWKSGIAALDEIKIERCFIPTHFTDVVITLHGFADACELSYGAVVYARVLDGRTGQVHVALLTAKARVAPLKNRRSLPELELMGALMLARLIIYVRKNLDLAIDSIYCWTDSQITLYWIRKPSYTWQTFVANRTAEMQKLVEPGCFRFIPGKLNPADVLSRGCSAENLVAHELWWKGPPFLLLESEHWPQQPEVSENVVKSAETKQRKWTVPVHLVVQENNGLQLMERYNSLSKFIGVMVKCRNAFSRGITQRNGDENIMVGLSQYREEVTYWTKWAQTREFSEEISALSNGQSLPKGSKINNLDPFLDEVGLLRVGGRCENASLPDQEKHPIIVPTRNPFVEMLIMDFHLVYAHAGAMQTLSNMRYKYWVVHGRQEVRRVLHGCIKCKSADTMGQKMAQLPLERITPSDTFAHVGTDFAGPLYIKSGNGSDENVKVYIAIFVDMACRGCHLELCEDMGTEAYIRCLERMMNRRGRCALVISDNAKTFKKTATLMDVLFKKPQDRKKLIDELRKRGIEWRFITEKAPWHGGFYERFVQSVKVPLRKVLGKTKLTYIELVTVLTDIEAQINSRPLTEVSADKEDPLPLTPAHLMVGRNVQVMPDLKSAIKSTNLGTRWDYRQTLTKQWWNRWTKEYLPKLYPYAKWLEEKPNAVVGQLVHVRDDGMKKMDWRLGRIVEAHPGRDGLVRSCTVKTSRGLIRRPVQRLALLECDDN